MGIWPSLDRAAPTMTCSPGSRDRDPRCGERCKFQIPDSRHDVNPSVLPVLIERAALAPLAFVGSSPTSSTS
jgi:hypothetical protein